MKKAIICDLDGTLALMGDRDPFNPKTIENDLLNNPVANILEVYTHQALFEIQIIFITGRFEKYRQQTDLWLKKHHINNYQLFMRKNGDSRKDIIYKKEIYTNHIKDTYDVLFVLEDRDQTVKMWRKELGLTCLQVEYGDF
ncbi:MAG: hypothetical protein QG639_1059 [Patescibacteria group bacterium]|nr:hypothetical protein [Patescibacteria group bacterium]